MYKQKYSLTIVLTPEMAGQLQELAGLKKVDADTLLPVLVHNGLQKELAEWLMEARCKASAAQAAREKPAPINWPAPDKPERKPPEPLSWKQALAMLCAEL